jgi:hypothetical protein
MVWPSNNLGVIEFTSVWMKKRWPQVRLPFKFDKWVECSYPEALETRPLFISLSSKSNLSDAIFRWKYLRFPRLLGESSNRSLISATLSISYLKFCLFAKTLNTVNFQIITSFIFRFRMQRNLNVKCLVFSDY